LSAAVVEDEEYWQNQPGQSSLDFNYALVAHGYLVQRCFIIDEYLWPPAAVLPSRDILSEIQNQAARGISVSLVRKSDLESEPELVCDFGVYGERAVGYQFLNPTGNTIEFVLEFGSAAVAVAEARWRQLELYAISLDELLDRPA
jgi:hypothetical protein